MQDKHIESIWDAKYAQWADRPRNEPFVWWWRALYWAKVVLSSSQQSLSMAFVQAKLLKVWTCVSPPSTQHLGLIKWFPMTSGWGKNWPWKVPIWSLKISDFWLNCAYLPIRQMHERQLVYFSSSPFYCFSNYSKSKSSVRELLRVAHFIKPAQ